MPMMGNTICTRKPLLQKPWWCPGRPFIQLEITGNSDVGLPPQKSTAMVCGERRVGTSLGFFHNFPTTTISFCLLLNVTGCYWLLVTVKALGYTPMIPPWYPQHLPSRFSWHFWVSQGQTQPFVNGAHDAHVSDCQVGTGGGTDGTDGIWLWTHLDRGLGEAGAAGWRRMIVMTHCHMAFIFLHLLYIHMNYKTRKTILVLTAEMQPNM